MATTVTSNTHIRKRPYQPSITSYFGRNAESDSRDSRCPAISPLSPPLPPETQSSLLSVGMRVRKSVPEGYKTHKTLAAKAIPFPSTAQPAMESTPQLEGSTGRSTELMPFCGLHKIGGLSSQPLPSSWSYAPSTQYGTHSSQSQPPSLISSQSTIASANSTASAPSKKRTFSDEIEYDMDAYFSSIASSSQSGKIKYPVSHTTMPVLSPASPVFRPTAKLKSKGSTCVKVRNQGQMDEDFEEAEFLVQPMALDDEQL